jgi:hypothetical protein
VRGEVDVAFGEVVDDGHVVPLGHLTNVFVSHLY